MAGLERLPRPDVVTLIKQNIASIQSRHLMVLTKNNAALSALFDLRILSHDRTEVIFGSDFPADKSDLQIFLNIQKVKNCMAQVGARTLAACAFTFTSSFLLNRWLTRSSPHQSFLSPSPFFPPLYPSPPVGAV